MGGNGKHRWKISFYHRPKPPQPPPEPPEEFLCPISGSLMSDPVIIPSGQTFDRLSLQTCLDLGFSPSQTTPTDISTVIPNLALKSTILSWCDSTGTLRPTAPDQTSLQTIVRSKIAESKESLIRTSDRELLNGVVDNPPVLFSHANTELTHRVNHFSSSSSDESVIVSSSTAASPLIPLPLTTKPACFSSCSTSYEIAETLSENPGSFSSKEEEEIVAKLKSSEVHEQEEGVVLLRKITRTREESRVLLCTPPLLLNLRPLIASRYGIVRVNAVASLVNLSLEKVNKVKIVRSGFVPHLIDVMKSGCSESQEHAVGAMFSLALEDENKMAIGVLGALQPLMHSLRSESARTRHDSALALYHLSLVNSNRVKLVKFGAVATLLSMVRSGEAASRLLLVLCNLASCNEGRSAMLDANAVGILVEMLREDSEAVDLNVVRENCVAVLFALSQGNMRFKGLAKEAKLGEVLRMVEEKGRERAKEKAKRILQMMKGREDEEVDWENVLECDGYSHYRTSAGGKDSKGPNSSNF